MESLKIFVLLFAIFNIVKAIEIKMYGFTYYPGDLTMGLQDRVNEYLKNRNSPHTFVAKFDTPATSSGDPDHIASSLEQLITKEQSEYDLYFTDTVYTGHFAKHFENLYKYIDKSIIDLYENGTASKTCKIDDKLVALPFNIDYGGLYSNMNLLEKYNKTVPETWEELIDTANYIYEKESNKKLIKYYGHFADYENGSVSFIEFIHSFRDKPTDDFPPYTSKNAVEALETMKKVKEQASTKDDFCGDEFRGLVTFNCGNFIFMRFWYMGEDFNELENSDIQNQFCPGPDIRNVRFTGLPGKKPGVSASCIGGNNISMSKHISEERKKAAAEIITFINSYDHQKRCIMDYNSRSAIHNTYNDQEICQKIDCDKFRSMQGIVRPGSSEVNYEQYSKTIRGLAKSYILGETDLTAKEIMQKIDDIRKIHFIELTSLTSILILSFTVLTVILLFSAYIYVSIKRFRTQFIFLPFNYWCVFILGIVITLFYCFTGIYKLEDYNCSIRPFLLSIGFSLIYVPLLLKMIIIFPKKNNLTKFVKDHFTLCFFLFLIIDIAINIAWTIVDPLIVEKKIIDNGKNFQYCRIDGTLNRVFEYILFGYKILILLVMCILVFAEWNLVAFRSDIRSITSTIYTNLLLIVMFIVLIHINIEDRYIHFGIKAGLVIAFCLSTLIIIIGSKVYQISFNKGNPYPEITSLKGSSLGNNGSTHYYQSSDPSSNKMNLISYHYQTGSPIKPNPTLFSGTYNNSYNDNIFTNSSNSSKNNSVNEIQSPIDNYNNNNRLYVNNNNGINNLYSNLNYNNSFTANNFNKYKRLF